MTRSTKIVLAAAWVWTDADDNVVQADVFFNAFHKWGVLSACDEPGKYDVGNVGTHEFGHVVGLDHLSKGENPDAKSALAKFIELAPDDPDAATAREMLNYLD